MNKQTKALKDLLEAVEHAIEIGDWKVDGRCDPDLAINRAKKALEQPSSKNIRDSFNEMLEDKVAYYKGKQPAQEALKMAIEALKAIKVWCYEPDTDMESAIGILANETLCNIQACKEALEQPAQEPVAWMSKKRGDVSKAKMYFNEGEEILPLYTHPAPAIEQEPVPLIRHENGNFSPKPSSLPNDLEFAYQRGYRAGKNIMRKDWIFLSDDEITNLEADSHVKMTHDTWEFDVYGFARAIEQELRTKNGFSDIKEKNL